MRSLKATYNSFNNSIVVNNFVIECIKTIFYLLFSAESDPKTCACFRASVHLTSHGRARERERERERETYVSTHL